MAVTELAESVEPAGALADLIGMRVRVWSNSGDNDHWDDGILEAFDHPWVRLRPDDNTIMCFPIYNVRLVKSLDPSAKKAKVSALLLRPARGPDDTE